MSDDESAAGYRLVPDSSRSEAEASRPRPCDELAFVARFEVLFIIFSLRFIFEVVVFVGLTVFFDVFFGVFEEGCVDYVGFDLLSKSDLLTTRLLILKSY